MNQSVLWLVRSTKDGVPGWIRSEVQGGPRDPASARMGTTLRLRCTSRIDTLTPYNVIDKGGHDVAFTLENYWERWVLLKKAGHAQPATTVV